MSKPTILMDMDGPLADFDAHYWRVATDIDNRTGTLYKSNWDISNLSKQRHRFLSDHMTSKRVERMARDKVNTSGWFAELHPTKGAADGMNELQEHADVWVCSKPLEANPTCRDEKARWLVEHIGEGWDRRLILAPDKSMIRGDLLVDDAIKAPWVPRATWVPVVFDTPWNQPGTKFGADWDRFAWSDGVEALLELATR